MNVDKQGVEVSISEIVNCLFSNKFKVIIFTCIAMFISLTTALYLPNKYQSTASLIVSQDSNSGLGALASSFGGLAGLAGVNLNSGQGARNAMIAEQLLKSKAFIVRFIKKNNLSAEIYAANNWDKTTNSIQYDQDIYNPLSGSWLLERGGEIGVEPLDVDLFKAFLDFFSLEEDSKTGVLTFKLEYFSPEKSQQWLTLLINEVNQALKRRDIEQSEKNINFLQQLADNTPNNSLKETFYNLIEEQTKTLMLAKVRDDYVFQIVDPPDFPEKKSSPRRALILILGTFVGLFISVFFILLVGFSTGKFDVERTEI